MTVMPKVSGSVLGPKKSKGTSKKTKKGWRKNVDISQVEDFLEDQRLEERLGGSFSDRPDQELFLIDKEVDTDSKPSTKRKKREEKPLKCYQHLRIEGGAPDPIRVRNRSKTPQERKNPTVVKKEKLLAEQGIVKAKAKLQKKHRELERVKKASKELERTTRRRTEFDFDLWGKGSLKNEDRKRVNGNKWLDDTTKIHNLKNTRNLERKQPADLLYKPSDLGAIELPHGGMSYNPSIKDHRDLLWKAAIVEINKERAEHKIEYHTTRMFPDAKNAPTRQTWLTEMSEGIPGLDKTAGTNDDDESDEVCGNEDGDGNAKAFKPKTKKQRNQAKRQKYAENRKKAAQEDKFKDTEFFRIKSIKRQLKESEKATAAKIVERVEAKKAKRLEAAKLSGHKFEEPELDLKLADELTGNLRNLKPEGNLVADRYKSLQKRNVIETRVRVKVKRNKKKRKRVEKRNHKMGFAWEK